MRMFFRMQNIKQTVRPNIFKEVGADGIKPMILLRYKRVSTNANIV